MHNRKTALCALAMAASASAFACPIHTSPIANKDTAKTIFVTGGTGMVGSRLVYDALKTDPTLTVACLVRGESVVERLEAKMREWQTWPEDARDRVVAVMGDVTEHRLGMSDSDYDYWVQHSDAVVHAAADIRLTRGDKSAIINAQACKEIFEFTNRGVKNPSLHFTSSIASCGIQLQSEYATETSDHPFEAVFPGGYGEQKWEAERYLVEKAAESSTLVSIYRVPFIINQKGFQSHSVPDILFQIAAITGAVPKAASYVPMHSLETISQCLVTNILRTMKLSGESVEGTGSAAEVFHLADTRQLTWEQQVEMLTSAGLCATIVPWKEYEQRLKAVSKVYSYARKLCCFLPLLEGIFKSQVVTLSTSKMQQVCLEEAGFDLAGANLKAKALNGSIGMSMQSLLEKVEPTGDLLNTYNQFMQFSSALRVEKSLQNRVHI
jgi:thioester reductase-like protein